MQRVVLIPIVLAALILPASASALTTLAGTEPTEPMRYGPATVETLAAFPAPVAGEKTVVFVHGGWWSAQPGEEPILDEKPLKRIQREDGALVVDVDYPQESRREAAYPMEYEAIVRAVLWAHEHAAEYGGDPNNIELIGGSAGGQVSELAAEHLETEHPGLLRSETELSAPGLNFVTFVQELKNGETGVSGAGPTADYLGCHVLDFYDDCSKQVEEERSPIFHIPPAAECAPQFVAWGEKADFVDKQQSIEFANALERDGCEVTRNPAPKNHAMAYFGVIVESLFAFLDAH